MAVLAIEQLNIMEQPAESVTLMLCLSLRCALPLALTLLLAHLLSRLDARWAREAQTTALGIGERSSVRQFPCWQMRGCSASEREYCPAYRQPERPCWQVFSQNGAVRHQCQACQVYQQTLALA